MPGVPESVEVEAKHHADIEQRLIANRPAAEHVLDRLLVAVGGVGQFGLRQLLLDHSRFDAVEGLGASGHRRKDVAFFMGHANEGRRRRCRKIPIFIPRRQPELGPNERLRRLAGRSRLTG